MDFGISVSMVRRNRSFSILFLIWFTIFPIPKSRQSAGDIFQALDNLFILYYTLLEKKEVPILQYVFFDVSLHK